MGGPALANNVLIVRYLASFAIGFIPGMGDAYFLASAVAGQDLFTGTSLSQHDRQFYAGMATLSLLTAVVGPGLFSQEAVAVERTVTELGDLDRLGTEAAHCAEDEARTAEAVAQEGRAVEGDASSGGRALSELSAGGIADYSPIFRESERVGEYDAAGQGLNVVGQENKDSCVAGCANMILRDAGIYQPDAWIRIAAGVDDSGGLISNLPDAFASVGLTDRTATYVAGGTIADLQRATESGPAVASVKSALGRHALIVDGFQGSTDDMRVLIRDPLGVGEGSAYQVNLSTFLTVWTGNFVHF